MKNRIYSDDARFACAIRRTSRTYAVFGFLSSLGFVLGLCALAWLAWEYLIQ